MEAFAAWVKSLVEDVLEWLLGVAAQVLEWLLTAVLWVVEKAWSLLLNGLAYLLEQIPVPAFMQQVNGFWGQIPGSIVYFFQFFAVAEGMAMIGAALALRFILRRIPVIG